MGGCECTVLISAKRSVHLDALIGLRIFGVVCEVGESERSDKSEERLNHTHGLQRGRC